VEEATSKVPVIFLIFVVIGAVSYFFAHGGKEDEDEEEDWEEGKEIDPIDTEIRLIEEARRGRKMKIG